MVFRMILVLCSLLPALASGEETALRSSFESSWYSVDSGGGVSTGAEFQVVGSIGQFDAHRSSGNSFEVFGGVLALVPETGCADLANGIFCYGFESGTLNLWTSAIGLARPSTLKSSTPSSLTSER